MESVPCRGTGFCVFFETRRLTASPLTSELAVKYVCVIRFQPLLSLPHVLSMDRSLFEPGRDSQEPRSNHYRVFRYWLTLWFDLLL